MAAAHRAAFAILVLTSCLADAEELKKPTSTPRRGNSSPLLRLKDAVGIDVVAHQRVLVEAIPSTLVLLVANQILKSIKSELKQPKIPHALVGMFLAFAGLVSLDDSRASKVVSFMKPGVDLLTSFLPAFFIPALVVSPLSLTMMSWKDSAKFFGAISIALPLIYMCTGRMVELLQWLQGSGTKGKGEPKQSAAPQTFQPPFSASLETLLTLSTAVSGAIALAHPGPAVQVFYSIATIYSYVFATRLPRMLHPTIARYWHPLLTSFTWSSAILAAFGALKGKRFFQVLHDYFIPGGVPLSAAGNYVLYWLEPSIITFAFGLYARKTLLFANALPILGGALTATVFGIFVMAGLGRLLAPSRSVRLALLPRATAALAVVQAATIGANPPLTAVNCCYTGIFCANFGVMMLDALRLSDPIARGVATGGGGLALASAALSTLDPAAFPFGALGMSLTSAMATVLFCIPQFTVVVLAVAGV